MKKISEYIFFTDARDMQELFFTLFLHKMQMPLHLSQ